jgi:hypothetical protein
MTNPANLKANKGQGVLEAVLILPVVVAFVSLLVFAGYRSLVYFYADAALHEAMICTDSTPTSQCENEFKKDIQKVILRNETVEVHINKNGGGKSFRLSGKVLIKPLEKRPGEIENIYWLMKIMIQKEMKFPLRGSR